ncbi:hypothetical protein Cni_G25609 [Canna indica]|uniref:NAC domain-containing protein n=1 Tax=Canna indica TaxID=4628 RepID=A0AAQ3QL76_9LILI|nr:hypothetical protein Cni_G25609 [Canna indica]
MDPKMELPGFRFHPTEEELLAFYLRPLVYGMKLNFDIIGCLNIYRHDPWELPGLAKIGEREWYFFVPRDRRSGNGGRPNRTTERGFWKATGSDRAIRTTKEPRQVIGMKKTLVFYGGRAPRGTKTDWVMNEYRLLDNSASITMPVKEDIVLCKVYRKATSLKELEQRAAKEEDAGKAAYTCMADTTSNSDQENYNCPSVQLDYNGELKEMMKEEMQKDLEVTSPTSTTVSRSVSLPELQVPKSGMEWLQDPFLLRSPWTDQWSPYNYANILNF